MNFSRIVLLAAVMLAPVGAALADERDALQAEVGALLRQGDGNAVGDTVAAPGLVAEVYERRNYSPAWREPGRVAELLAVIRASESHGLEPRDYHLDAVESFYARLRKGDDVPAAERSAADIVLTDSLVRLAYHELFGKVNPYELDADWNFGRELGGRDPVVVIQEILSAESITAALDSLVPRGWVYRNLQRALADYREIEARGGWPEFPDGPVLKPGQADDRLELLAQRLAVSGDLDAGEPRSASGYEGRLVAAVQGFQERHGLDPDGILGPATRRALNVPVGQRIRQLEISLERARWVMHDLGDDFVLVNIAGFRVYVVKDRQVSWSARVQVGTAYRKSPVFRDEMTYLDFNPTWTVPYSIATRDILPQVRKDPDYLARRGFIVRDRNGNVAEPRAIDWSALRAGNFPYTFVQQPGPTNALGRVKFMFPNKHAVYLHDTPSRYLFERAERAFSSGCIRVEQPFELAEILLREDGWDQRRILDLVDSGETKRVLLRRPMPVLLMYWTAEVVADGRVFFYNDIYERDGAVSAALDEPFRLEPPGS